MKPMTGSFTSDKTDYYLLEDVPWTIYYDGPRALHGAYWRALFGYEQSHGCVNLSVGDAHWLFDWANIGDWVYVLDPSGETLHRSFVLHSKRCILEIKNCSLCLQSEQFFI